MYLSKEVWGPDAREFNPDRWFSQDIAAKEKHFIPMSIQPAIPGKKSRPAECV